jgi:hypothetical protein
VKRSAASKGKKAGRGTQRRTAPRRGEARALGEEDLRSVAGGGARRKLEQQTHKVQDLHLTRFTDKATPTLF